MHRLRPGLILKISYGHTSKTSRYATLMTYSSMRQRKSSMRSMCAKWCSDLRNSASVEWPRCPNLESRKSVYRGLLSLQMESSWNRTGPAQSSPGRHQSQSETSRSSWDSSGNMAGYIFHFRSGDTTSRVPMTRYSFDATTQISNASRHPKCSPEGKPGGRKLFRLTTL